MDGSKRTSNHIKPNLTVREQVAHLKSHGVTSELVTEGEDAQYLSNANNYLRTRS